MGLDYQMAVFQTWDDPIPDRRVAHFDLNNNRIFRQRELLGVEEEDFPPCGSAVMTVCQAKEFISHALTRKHPCRTHQAVWNYLCALPNPDGNEYRIEVIWT